MSKIHPTAIVEKGAKLGENITIEPYAIIKENVTLGDNVTIKSHAYIDGHTTIGEGTVVYPSASIGTKTQAKKYQGEITYVKIGKNCEIREFVTINSSCGEGSTVEVGDGCLIMAYCHIAHHCKVGHHVIMANGAMLAGHVEIEDYANIGGMTPIHQFVRVGTHAMVGGLSRITNDIPPYTLGAGIPYRVAGLNLIGLKRHDFKLELRKDLTKAFKLIYRSGIQLSDAVHRIENEVNDSPPVRHWIDFIKTSKRGLIGLHPAGHETTLPDAKDLLEE
ncbi:MAG: acyl-ACP--UDP-N-acetylglucosamine O-acyltransferase [Chlamydiia bacterium]|nr:acyl-ACP--UDP-N-acetylglucosamine O-acyltransferase [Chlamydiia bacterium]